jgi:hypothetical protein
LLEGESSESAERSGDIGASQEVFNMFVSICIAVDRKNTRMVEMGHMRETTPLSVERSSREIILAACT